MISSKADPSEFDFSIYDEFSNPVLVLSLTNENLLFSNLALNRDFESNEIESLRSFISKSLKQDPIQRKVLIKELGFENRLFTYARVQPMGSIWGKSAFMAVLGKDMEVLNERETIHFEILKRAEIGLKCGSWYYDIEKNEVLWSNGLFEIFGIDKSTLDKVSVDLYHAYVHPDDLAPMLSRNSVFMEKGELTEDYVHRIITPKGEVKLLNTNASVLERDDSGIKKIIGYVSDISKVRKIELDLSQSISELNEANFLMKNFASFASHDLQEPLRKIQIYAGRLEAALEGSTHNKADKYLQSMLKAIGRLQNLMKSILDLSSLGKGDLQKEQVDLNVILKNICEDYELKIREKNAKVIFDLPTVLMDASQAHQLFQNLVNNSLKFVEDGVSPQIEVSYTKVDGSVNSEYNLDYSKSYFKIVFKDNGIGFKNEEAQELFKAFKRLNPKHLFEGNGIGLSICERIVKNHGGNIIASKGEKQGAEFVIYLPIT